MAFAVKGDKVKVDYIAMLGGRVIATSMKGYAKDAGIYRPDADYSPLAFSIGSGEQAFEDALIGLRQGEEKTIVFRQQAVMHRPELVRKYPRAMFEHTGIALKEGMDLRINTSKGPLHGKVSALDEKDVALDLNPGQPEGVHSLKIILREIAR